MLDFLFKLFLILTPFCIAGLAIALIEKICGIYETYKDVTKSLIKLLVTDNRRYFKDSDDANFIHYIETYLYHNTDLSKKEIRKFIKNIKENV
jgi:hypothetical protein